MSDAKNDVDYDQPRPLFHDSPLEPLTQEELEARRRQRRKEREHQAWIVEQLQLERERHSCRNIKFPSPMRNRGIHPCCGSHK